MNFFFVVASCLFAGFTIYKTVHSKIIEKESLLWIFIAIVIMLLGLFPASIMIIAGYLGIDYAPSLLFLISSLLLFLINYRHSIKISELDQKLKELAQMEAILQCQVNEMQQAKYDTKT